MSASSNGRNEQASEGFFHLMKTLRSLFIVGLRNLISNKIAKPAAIPTLTLTNIDGPVIFSNWQNDKKSNNPDTYRSHEREQESTKIEISSFLFCFDNYKFEILFATKRKYGQEIIVEATDFRAAHRISNFCERSNCWQISYCYIGCIYWVGN